MIKLCCQDWDDTSHDITFSSSGTEGGVIYFVMTQTYRQAVVKWLNTLCFFDKCIFPFFRAVFINILAKLL